MLKGIKNIAVLVVLTFYVFQLAMVFSNPIIEKIQEIRIQIQVSKIHLAETKTISFSEWNSFSDKKEIKLNHVYYDVLSYKIVSNTVIINAVQDNYENNFKIIFDTLSNKKGIPHSDKKKHFNPSNFITVLNNAHHKIENGYNFLKTQASFYALVQHPNKISSKIDKPPRKINLL
ncbi:MAG: hypothetical protein RL494_824 [Bacteroidota bacterium]|jgi:hypothetical protein